MEIKIKSTKNCNRFSHQETQNLRRVMNDHHQHRQNFEDEFENST